MASVTMLQARLVFAVALYPVAPSLFELVRG